MTAHLTCFITDDRHAVPSLALLVGLDSGAARRFAVDDLQNNPHHVAIEVRDGDRLICAMRRDELSTPPAR